MTDSPNGIVIKQAQVSALIGLITIAGTWYGASKPEQPKSSVDNQVQILSNQSTVISNQEFIKTKLAALEGNQEKILKALEKKK